MKYFLLLIIFSSQSSFAQKSNHYGESLKAFQLNYVNTHEVVNGSNKQYFNFFPINKKYAVVAKFEKATGTDSLKIRTSKGKEDVYYRYGKLSFKINDTSCVLYLYQSPALMRTVKYKDYLFLPFTDLTSAVSSYGGGRYIDIVISDIKNNKLLIDFNKAYNPYCAYSTGYNCPIPPKESNLSVAIPAGEKIFGKAVH